MEKALVIIGWIFVPYIMAPLYIFRNLAAIQDGNSDIKMRAGGGVVWAIIALSTVVGQGGDAQGLDDEKVEQVAVEPNGDDDGDGVLNAMDCDPKDAAKKGDRTKDKDCDGVVDAEDCAVSDSNIATRKADDTDCDGLKNDVDCNPKEVSELSKETDSDCDGIPNGEDCNPNGGADDLDCDGVANADDCDPRNAGIKTKKSEDLDCDGTPEVRAEAFAEVRKFKSSNELKQESIKKSFPGTVLHGSGKVFEVGTCGFTDKSEKYGDDCIKITLDKGDPRVVLYFDSKYASVLSNLSKGARYTFENCVATDITDWGFWATATCDMPEDVVPLGAGSAKTGTSSPTAIDSAKAAAVPAGKMGGGRTEAFGFVERFKGMNELKQNSVASDFAGTVLHGSGKVFEVGECGFMDKSEEYGSDCIKITLDKGIPRVVLYFDSSESSTIENVAIGSRYSFDNCVATDITDWGMWATATCDMPR